MNKLKKAAGLLNDEAPKGEFLAYINAKEAGLLSSQGGSGKMTKAGIRSYTEDEEDTGDVSNSSSSSSSDDNSSGGDYDYNYAMSVQNQIDNTPTSDNDDIDSQYTTGKEFNVDPINQPSVLDYARDELRNKTMFGSKTLGTASTANAFYNTPLTASINALFSGYTAKRDAERKTEPTLATGEDGIGEGDYKSTVGDWAESRGLTDDYSKEDNETQQAIDKAAFDAGFRTEDAKDMNLTGGDSNNPPPTIDSNSAAIPDSIRTVNTAGTGLPDPSGWINSYIGSKANFQDLYDNVKNTLYSSRTQQGLLAVSDSPYYDFLKLNKLDRRVL